MVLLANEGIIEETPTIVDSYYKKYDSSFENSERIGDHISKVMKVIEDLYSYFNGNMGCFTNKNYFFTLFCVVYNQMYGIKGTDLYRNPIFTDKTIDANIRVFEKYLSDFIGEFEKNKSDKDNLYGKYAEYTEFAKIHSIRTTSKNERTKRIRLLNTAFGGDSSDC